MQGALDKAVLMDAIAASLTVDRDFNELVLRKIASAGNAADEQAAAWFKFVKGLPYRRERGEVYRAWRECVEYGGDCDDLTIILVGGLLSIGIPACTEMVIGPDGWAFHVRARAGLPPHDPKRWVILDPVAQSERQWAMADVDLAKSLLVSDRDHTMGVVTVLVESSLTPMLFLAAVVAAWLLGRSTR
jgi:hypothetical protein